MRAGGATSPSEPELIVLPDPEAVSAAAAARVAALLAAAVRDRAVANWATTGGSTPTGIYRALGSPHLRGGVPWDRVHVWFADDRYVPRDHPLSNVRLVDDILLRVGASSGQSGSGESGIDVALGRETGVLLPAGNIHPFPCTEAIGDERGPEWCAERYAEEVARAVATDGGSLWPAFDLVLLGVGRDGHILSVFPGSPVFDSTALGLAIPAPTHIEPHVPRVTLNPAILDVARSVIVVVHGDAKADALARVFGPERDERRWPAKRARRAGATWILDEAAAAALARA